jgi:VWFA-related protein
MIKKGGSILVAALLAVSMFTSVAVSQDKKTNNQDVVRISTELVQIDVIVTDKSNHPVGNLKREDFELYDNNKVQHISHFSYETVQSTSVTGETDEIKSLPKAVAAQDVKRVLAFVVDTLHMKPESVYRTRQMLENFISSQMERGDLALILPTAGGSGLFQQFTADQNLLRRAAERLRPFIFSTETTPHRSIGNPLGMSGPGASSPGMGRGGLPQQRPPQPRLPGTNIDPLEEADARSTLRTLDNLIDSMKQLPGRKLALFVSEGFRIFQTDTSQSLRDTTDRAGRAGVIFYTIDPRGLDPLGLEASDDLGDQDVTEFLSNKRDDFHESQDSLNALALDTGGKFFHDNNDIKRGLGNMLVENSSYYLLGYQPESSKWDGKYHKLRVVVRDRPDLNVSFRKGYLARDDKPKVKPNADPVVAENIAAISSPLVRRDIDLRLTPFYSDDPNHELVMMTLVHIDASRLQFNRIEGRYQDKLDLIGFVLDANGKTVDGFKDTLDLNLLPQTYENALKSGFVSRRLLTVKPGIYQMRVLVREAETGKLGTANNYIEVPNLKSDRLSVSSIFMTPSGGEPGKPADTSSGATMSQRRFKRGSQVDYYMVVYNAASEGHDARTQLEWRTRILQGGKPVFSSQPRILQGLSGSTAKRIVGASTLTLGPLPAGEYTLELAVIDKLRKKDSHAVAKQEIDFSIEQ